MRPAWALGSDKSALETGSCSHGLWNVGGLNLFQLKMMMTTFLSYDILQIGVIYLKMPALFLQGTIWGSAQGPFWISAVSYLVVIVISSCNILVWC